MNDALANAMAGGCGPRHCIEPDTVAAHLRRGCPVVVTGSNGPEFSVIVLFLCPQPLSSLCDARLGTALRWTAALAGLDTPAPPATRMAEILSNRAAAAIEPTLVSNPALVPTGGLKQRRSGWADLLSIFTFGMRDPLDRRRLLSAAELRPLYQHLAQERVLLGQPVGVLPFGSQRLAFGARDLPEPSNNRLTSVYAMLEAVTTLSRHSNNPNLTRARQPQETAT